MKYSIIISYIPRLEQWQRAAKAWTIADADLGDWEFVLAIDAKCTPEEKNDAIQAAGWLDLVVVDLPPESKDWHNMASAVNLAVEASNGDNIILTGQEILPPADVFHWFDMALAIKPDAYFAGACMSLDESGQLDGWYQHSTLSHNHHFHFCACCSKETFWKAGGFDDEYSLGYAVEDSEWTDRLAYAGVEVYAYDTVVVAHQAHSRQYSSMPAALQSELHDRNQAIITRNRIARAAGTWQPVRRGNG